MENNDKPKEAKGSSGSSVKRNVLVFTLFEGSYRLGELFNITIGGLQFEDIFHFKKHVNFRIDKKYIGKIQFLINYVSQRKKGIF
jgi:hypothetical protein